MARFRSADISGLGIRLRTYFMRKRKLYEESYPEFYDKDLKKLFTENVGEGSKQKASQFLRSNRKKILKTVALWTQERQYTVDQLLQNLVERCNELKLVVKKGDADIQLNIAAYVTSLVTAYLFTGKFKRLR